MKKTIFYSLVTGLLAFGACSNPEETPLKTPNVIVVFADDMGYGDTGAFGHPTIHTPNLDRMAEEGQKWTNFYAASSVCTPSRAGLLTGKLPIRNGMCGETEDRRVLFPDSDGGLPQTEITIAKALKTKGYSTACIGKWHLGHLPQYMPQSHGFDYYFGVPYSNDMDRPEGIDHKASCFNPKIEYFQVPLYRNQEIIEKPVNQLTITKRYTEEALKFIDDHKAQPFFIYLAHSMPHVPLFASKDFEGKSRRGRYGDVIEEIDWSVGQIMQKLKQTGLDENTLVVFTSDNGPWLLFDDLGGSAGLLKGGKGSTYEGGMREPSLFWWPEKLEKKVVMDMASTLDLYPTICKLTGVEISNASEIDGYDLSPVLFGNGKSNRDEIFYYRETEIFAIRKGAYKVHFKTQTGYEGDAPVEHNPPLLFNLENDPSEKYNIAAKHPDIIKKMVKLKEEHINSFTPGDCQLIKRIESADINQGDVSL